MKQLKAAYAKQDSLWTSAAGDVTHKIVIEHEKQVQRFGFMNLFHKSYILMTTQPPKQELSLSDMKISNPKAKYLWVRYCRSGDGERFTQGVEISSDGYIKGAVCKDEQGKDIMS